jgi:hypothetical protein
MDWYETYLWQMKQEAANGACPVCGEVHRTVCPECDRTFKDGETYCGYCGFIRNQPWTTADDMKKESGY